jgi:hypothetical protein
MGRKNTRPRSRFSVNNLGVSDDPECKGTFVQGEDTPPKYRQFKCKKCLCVNAFFEDDAAAIGILENGYGLHPNFHTHPYCRCVCHSGNATKKPEIMTRVIECQS